MGKISVLNKAVQEGDIKSVEKLIAKGKDVNAEDGQGNRPLILAVKDGNKEMAELLIELGADINCFSYSDGSPLHSAAQCGHIEVARLLIDKGAWVNFPDNHLESPLFKAARCGHPKIVELLLAHGANTKPRDNTESDWDFMYGHTPRERATLLHAAAEGGCKSFAEQLIAKGADVNAEDRYGATPLKLAKQNGHKQVAKLLRKHGAKE